MDSYSIKTQFEEYLGKIDRKRRFNEYTMGECEIIAKQAKAMMGEFSFDPEDEFTKDKVQQADEYFDKAIAYSERHHNDGRKSEAQAIMDVLNNADAGLQVFLEIFE